MTKPSPVEGGFRSRPAAVAAAVMISGYSSGRVRSTPGALHSHKIVSAIHRPASHVCNPRILTPWREPRSSAERLTVSAYLTRRQYHYDVGLAGGLHRPESVVSGLSYHCLLPLSLVLLGPKVAPLWRYDQRLFLGRFEG